MFVYLGIYYSRIPKRVWYSGSPSAMATPRGLEPPTSSVTGWHSTLLNYEAIYKIDFSLNLYVYIILKIYRKIKLFTKENFVAGATGFEPVELLWSSLP